MTDPTILLYYDKHFFDRPAWTPMDEDCKCTMTEDRRLLPKVKCVVFHIPSLPELDRTLLYELRQTARPNQIWVAWSKESVVNYPLLDDPQCMELFDYEMSYRQSADIFTPYLRPHWPRKFVSVLPRQKKRLCAAFVSSGLNSSRRQEFLEELAQYIPIDSYGKFMRNRRILWDRGRATKTKVISRYRFTLAFENSICPDYVTEKLFEPFIAGSIPVYLGAPNAEEFAPGDDAYINVSDFSSIKELAQYMKSVDDSRYHEWRTKPLRQQFIRMSEQMRGNPFDRVCDLIAASNKFLEPVQ